MTYHSYEEIRKIIEIAEKLKKECKHEETQQIYTDSVECSICGQGLGWWCPDSPNHVCEYYGNHERGRPVLKKEVENLNNTKPINWDDEYVWSYKGEWYDGDDCIYCGNPEERK